MGIHEMTPQEIILALLEKLGTQMAISEAILVDQAIVSRWLNGQAIGMRRSVRELARQALELEE